MLGPKRRPLVRPPSTVSEEETKDLRAVDVTRLRSILAQFCSPLGWEGFMEESDGLAPPEMLLATPPWQN